MEGQQVNAGTNEAFEATVEDEATVEGETVLENEAPAENQAVDQNDAEQDVTTDSSS